MINQVEPNISHEDIQNVTEYMKSGSWITEHNITKKLEDNVAKYVNRKYSVAVPNGTIAIYLALIASGIKQGHRVVVPNITMIATINAIIWAGAEPVIVDIDSSLCMSKESLQKVSDIDAVIFVPLNGRTGKGLEIQNYCKKNNIILIEDSAHALGSSYTNQKCGSLGNISILSFTPHKIITMGQGGMVLLDDDDVYQNLIDLKTFNREKDKSDIHKGFGLNFKITDLQASLGLSQFNKLQEFIDIKNKLYDEYSKYIDKKYLKDFEDSETPWFIDLYCDTQKQREELSLYLSSKNIETRYSYPSLSSQSYLREINKTKLSFSDEISGNILWLPSSTNLTDEEIKYVSMEVNSFFDN
jgi:perosamine synthetase